jgi:hypothetical protein
MKRLTLDTYVADDRVRKHRTYKKTLTDYQFREQAHFEEDISYILAKSSEYFNVYVNGIFMGRYRVFSITNCNVKLESTTAISITTGTIL